MKKNKRWFAIVLMMAIMLCLVGCKKEEKIRDLDFTVVSSECIPKELLTEIEGKKQEPFQMSFQDGNYLYMCVGYGKQETGGYSICVKDLYLTDSSIVLDTTLLGPKETGNKKISGYSYPYIVIKTEYIDAVVIFS